MKDIGTKRKLHVVPLLEDENFVYNNAVITAEIAVAQAILDHPKALCDITAAVTGGGRIALSTVDKLIKLGCKKVLCFARNPKQLDRASYLGAYAYELPIGDRLSGVDIVFNTIPAPVIANEELLNLPKGAILYELASSSGFDLAFAVTSGIDSRSALGLPGKFAPMSAASLIWENSQKYLVL
jgi:dipicolinate synthase subunit A